MNKGKMNIIDNIKKELDKLKSENIIGATWSNKHEAVYTTKGWYEGLSGQNNIIEKHMIIEIKYLTEVTDEPKTNH